MISPISEYGTQTEFGQNSQLGGWTNPCEQDAGQIGSSPQVEFSLNHQSLKPPHNFNMISTNFVTWFSKDVKQAEVSGICCGVMKIKASSRLNPRFIAFLSRNQRYPVDLWGSLNFRKWPACQTCKAFYLAESLQLRKLASCTTEATNVWQRLAGWLRCRKKVTYKRVVNGGWKPWIKLQNLKQTKDLLLIIWQCETEDPSTKNSNPWLVLGNTPTRLDISPPEKKTEAMFVNANSNALMSDFQRFPTFSQIINNYCPPKFPIISKHLRLPRFAKMINPKFSLTFGGFSNPKPFPGGFPAG